MCVPKQLHSLNPGSDLSAIHEMACPYLYVSTKDGGWGASGSTCTKLKINLLTVIVRNHLCVPKLNPGSDIGAKEFTQPQDIKCASLL